MKFFGVVFLVTTTLVMIFKKETNNSEETDGYHHSIEDSLTLCQTYKIVWRILCLPSVQILGLILITCKVKYYCNKKMIENFFMQKYELKMK